MHDHGAVGPHPLRGPPEDLPAVHAGGHPVDPVLGAQVLEQRHQTLSIKMRKMRKVGSFTFKKNAQKRAQCAEST